MKKITPTRRSGLVAPKSETCEHPGIILSEEFLQPHGISQAGFAKHIGVSPMTISDLINGKRGINAKLALLLSRALGTTPDFWLNMQTSYDYGREVQKMRRSGEYQKIEAIEKFSLVK